MQHVLLLFDAGSLTEIRDGCPPRTAMSHDQNLFGLGAAALSRGHRVFFCGTEAYHSAGAVREMLTIEPTITLAGEVAAFEAVRPDVIFVCHVQLFAWGQAPYARKVGIHPALYFIEMPGFYPGEQTLEQLLAVRHHADYLLVQNERMKDILMAFYGWLANWEAADRILVAPMSLRPAVDRVPRAVARRALRCAGSDVAIVNGGGIWRWTGFNDFLRGFIAAVRAGNSNLVLFTTGFRQPLNEDHGGYIDECRAILADNADLVGDRLAATPAQAARVRIHVEEDWQAASAKIPTFLSGADLGLNVNRGGLENWQSQRVRCLEYLRYGVPLMSTPGDNFSEHVAGAGVIRLPSLAPAAVAATLAATAAAPETIAAARRGAAAAAAAAAGNTALGDALDVILAGDKRQPDLGSDCVLEATWQDASGDARHRLAVALGL